MDNETTDDRDKPTPDWVRPPEPPLHRAARKGDLIELAKLLEGGADIEERADVELDHGLRREGLTALMVAARSVDGASVETLRWLVDHGADCTARSRGGNTAAWYAAGDGGRWESHPRASTPDHAERLRYLLGLGLDACESDCVGHSLMTAACEAGDPARVRVLLDAGARAVNESQQPRGPSYSERIESLFDHGLPGMTHDTIRGEGDDYEIPLFCAARSGSSACVELILKAGADPNTRDASGNTALMVAGSAAVVATLLNAGTDLHATNEYGADAFEAILEPSCDLDACGPGQVGVAKALVEAGVEIERVNQYGKSRLASAAFGHHAKAVQILLELGADASRLDSEGETPLHAICWQGEYEDDDINRACDQIIRTLVAAGTPVNAVNARGMTAMHEAADGDWGNQTAISTLVELGADPDAADHDGTTPLMIAAQGGEVRCIELLLQAGADPRRQDKHGGSALDAAKSHLRSWDHIVAQGPDQAMAEDELRMKEAFAREFDIPLANEPMDLAQILSENTALQQTALNNARAAVDIITRAGDAQPGTKQSAPD